MSNASARVSSGEPTPACVAPSHKRVRVSSGCRGGAGGVLDSAPAQGRRPCAVTAPVVEEACALLTPMPTLHYNSTRLPGSDRLDSSDLELTFRVSPSFLAAVEVARRSCAAPGGSSGAGGRASVRAPSSGVVDPAVLATLVSAELLYFDGSVPQVCVEEEDAAAAFGVRMTMSALPSLAPRCVLVAASRQLTLTIKRTFPISSGHGNRRFMLAFGLAGEVVLTRPFVVLAKKAKAGVPAKVRLQPELVEVSRARGEVMARLSALATAAAATAVASASGSALAPVAPLAALASPLAGGVGAGVGLPVPVPCALPVPVAVRSGMCGDMCGVDAVSGLSSPSTSAATYSSSSVAPTCASSSGAPLLVGPVGSKRCRVEGEAEGEADCGAQGSEAEAGAHAPCVPLSPCPLSSLAPFTPPQGVLCGGGAAELEVFEHLWGVPCMDALSPLAPLSGMGFGADLDLGDFDGEEWAGLGMTLQGAVSPFATCC